MISLAPRLDDTEQRLSWKVAALLGTGIMPGTPSTAGGVVFSFAPAAATVTWMDVGGIHQGDLAAFRSTADTATVSLMSLHAGGLTSVAGLGALPSLQSLDVGGNPLLMSFSVVGCAHLTLLEADNCSLTVECVNTLLYDLLGSGNAGGEVYLYNQATPAPPSVGPPNGIQSAALLAAEVPAWTVMTD